MKTLKPYLKKKFLLPLWFVVVFAFILIPKQTVVLTDVKGVMNKIEVASNGRSGESYYLYMDNDSHSYLIPAGIFKKEIFELNNKQGDKIELRVDQSDLEKERSVVDVYEVWSDKGPYLRKEDATGKVFK